MTTVLVLLCLVLFALPILVEKRRRKMGADARKQAPGVIGTLFAASQPGRLRQLILLAPAGMGLAVGRIGRFIANTPYLGDWLMLALYPGQMRKAIFQRLRLRAQAV